MTAEQVLGIADTLLKRDTPAPATPTPPSTPSFDFADDEYVSGAQLKRVLERASAPSGAAIEMAASANLSLVRNKYTRDFERYGGEIDALLRNVPTELRTLDNLERVVKMVRSDHVDEIAQERANELASRMEPTLRSNGAAAPPAPVQREHSLESDKIPAEWLERARKAGVTERVVDEFCRANDMTPASFYKQFETPLNRIVEDIPNRRQG